MLYYEIITEGRYGRKPILTPKIVRQKKEAEERYQREQVEKIPHT
ncbi:hypothetical protein QGN29_05900 [Temperatibacter marinus]|uniref:Uncharacterized protein n=1 Tax=Temperatibacter marinus TaxID=1456591 RepID=A0AA52EK11_9PROT|nr:hypothetical protein [Temperatibacter marinus]WND03904.1 hypothetical protein QGN29_05900 [Temperatibacter marinus]